MLGAPSSVLVFSNEVKNAFQTGQGIVALESTIISHGMPYPQNVETARQVENTIREGGACPATIALMDGKIKVGNGGGFFFLAQFIVFQNNSQHF